MQSLTRNSVQNYSRLERVTILLAEIPGFINFLKLKCLRAMKHLHMKKHVSENYPEAQGKDHQIYSCDICEFSATNKHYLNLHRNLCCNYEKERF